MMRRYRPASLLSELFRELSPDFNRPWFFETPEMPTVAGTQWQPSVDIKEYDDKFVILADIPGVDPKKIEVNMDDGMLSIRGERETEKKEETDKYKRIERE